MGGGCSRFGFSPTIQPDFSSTVSASHCLPLLQVLLLCQELPEGPCLEAQRLAVAVGGFLSDSPVRGWSTCSTLGRLEGQPAPRAPGGAVASEASGSYKENASCPGPSPVRARAFHAVCPCEHAELPDLVGRPGSATGAAYHSCCFLTVLIKLILYLPSMHTPPSLPR